jgi:pimeloyl-ACP methyl ester carboxylesterase
MALWASGARVLTSQQPKFVERPCTEIFGSFDSSTRDIARCGTVTVPQDRAAPNDSHLISVVLPTIVYASPSAHATPLVFLSGGPGESGIESVQEVLFATPTGQMMIRERPIIAFDRRGVSSGTGRNSPDLGTVPYTPRYPRPVATGPMRDSADATAKAMRAHGVEPRNFTTLASLEDIADVIRALGYKRVILFGVSYGTRDALQFMHRHPDMVEAAVLDGVAPPNATTILDSAVVANAGLEIVARIIADCKRDPSCAAEYADLPQAMERLAKDSVTAMLKTANFPVAGGWRTLKVSSSSVLSVLGLASTSELVRAEVPRVVVDFANSDTLRNDLSARVLAAAASDPTLAPWREERVPFVRYVVYCADRPQGEPYAGDRSICDRIHVPFAGGEAVMRISSDIPTLLLSSGDDAQTPYHLAVDQLRTLSHGQQVLFPTVGHVAFPRPIAMACAAIVIESFLAQPDRPAATGCVDSVAPAFEPRGLTPRPRGSR